MIGRASATRLTPVTSARSKACFVDLYRKGLIYRGRRMINWDPAAQTALSDEEVISKAQKGSLYYVRYQIVDEPGRFLEVATTRPETIMADTAVAVHPGRSALPGSDRKQVMAAAERARKFRLSRMRSSIAKFGTGVLKVTPAHDKLDFEIGQRHQLAGHRCAASRRPYRLSRLCRNWTDSIDSRRAKRRRNC